MDQLFIIRRFCFTQVGNFKHIIKLAQTCSRNQVCGRGMAISCMLHAQAKRKEEGATLHIMHNSLQKIRGTGVLPQQVVVVGSPALPTVGTEPSPAAKAQCKTDCEC
jgi:hypothetical protein